MEKKNVLVILGHPDADSYCHALFEAYVGGLDRDRCDVETLELGALDFDPVLRFGYRQRMAPDPVIERSHELVAWADHLVFIFPVWWQSMPALLKGWFDRVFTPGFAYNYEHKGMAAMMKTIKHLKGRSATVITTCDGPSWWYSLTGTQVTRLVKSAILGFCGIKVTRTLCLSWANSTTKDSAGARARFLAKVTQNAAHLR